MSETPSSLTSVIRYLRRCIGYESMITLLSASIVFSSGTHTAVFPFLFAVGGVFCLWLMLYTMKAAACGDTQRYPYGTGRLENVCAILLALLIAIGTLIPFVHVLQNLWSGHLREVRMGWTFLLLLVSATGNALNARRAKCIRQKTDNPILTSLHHMYHAGSVRDGCSGLVIGLCWLVQSGSPTVMSWLDSVVTLALSVYSLVHFVPQIWENFCALADFPLSETDQLKIMAILAKHFEAYEMVGQIYTARRGNTPVFEVELGFAGTMPLAQLLALEETMRQDFRSDFPRCMFRILPQVDEP